MSDSDIDEVLDERAQSLFRGSPKETVMWLRERPEMRCEEFYVRIGATTQDVLVSDYLIAVETKEKSAADEKFAKLLEMVTTALKKQDQATCRGNGIESMDVRASITADEIMEFFKGDQA